MAANSAKGVIVEFKDAIECMSPLEVKQCLCKTLNFLNKNDSECCFPNISLSAESFLVGLVLDTRNLKCKLFNADCEKLALEIIEVLKLNRDIFRWTYAFEPGSLKKNLLVYKKIFSNKIKMKPTESKKSVSLISQRLALSQSQDPTQTQFDIPTGCKIQLLNTTLRFLKTDGEGVLHYPDMPITHAQYMCTLVDRPKSDMNVGFGFKSLYAPLFEALESYGLEYEFKISFEKNGDIASLKLEKIRRNKVSAHEKDTQQNCLDKKSTTTTSNSVENSWRSECVLETNSKGSNSSLNISLNSSTSSNRSKKARRRRNRQKLPDGVPDSVPDGLSDGFVLDTLRALIAFTADVTRASITFEGLTDQEAVYIKGIKTLAASTSKHGSLAPSVQNCLRQLNSNVGRLTETCKIRIEDGTKSKARYITLKKVPRETPVAKPKSILFKSAGQLDPSTGEIQTIDKPELTTDSAQAKTKDLNKRQAKLLEDMSVPIESDKGKRMMELMGWAGGALGARAGGILEPILPAIDLPAGAGLGHVAPPKPPKPETRHPADFRLALLHNLRDLLLHPAPSKLLQFKLPLTKKERSFVNTVVARLNTRKALPVGVKVEQEQAKLLQELMQEDTQLIADVSQDLRNVTLTKFKGTRKSMKQLAKVKEIETAAMAALDSLDCELVDDEAIWRVMATITHTSCRTPVALKTRATRILFLMGFGELVRGSRAETEFRLADPMQSKLVAFLESVVACLNKRVRCSHVADEERHLYDDLVLAAGKADCCLDIQIHSSTKFIVRKRTKAALRQNLTQSACPKPAQDGNNNVEQNKSISINSKNNQNLTNNTIENSNKSGKDTDTSNLNETLAAVSNYKEVATVKTKCDSEANILVHNESVNSVKVKDVMQTKSDLKDVSGLVKRNNVKVEEVAKMQNECDIKYKNKAINSITNRDIVKQEIKTDDDSENSWSTCSENQIDISGFDKEIEELDKALGETGLGFNVRDSASSVTPSSDCPDHGGAKKTKKRCKNSVLVIAPKSPNAEIHTEIYKMVQTLIWNQIDKDEAIPLLKCHGVQNGGLVYSCYDDKDVSWLKRTINFAELDLKMFVFTDDFIEEKKSRKMVIKINSFMPLDAKDVFKRIELYNDVDTQLWKVLSSEFFSTYVLFVVEVDEISFEYISEDNFSLYMGIDKAQFSIIF